MEDTALTAWVATYAACVATVIAIKDVVDFLGKEKERRTTHFKKISEYISGISYGSSQDHIANVIENINRTFDYDVDCINKISSNPGYLDFKTDLIDGLELIKYNLSLSGDYQQSSFYDERRIIIDNCRVFAKRI